MTQKHPGDTRLQWDAEAAFKRIERHAENKPRFIECGRTFGKDDSPYTPPKSITPARLAQLSAMTEKPKGRDYEALSAAAKRKPVGFVRLCPICKTDDLECECNREGYKFIEPSAKAAEPYFGIGKVATPAPQADGEPPFDVPMPPGYYLNNGCLALSDKEPYEAVIVGEDGRGQYYHRDNGKTGNAGLLTYITSLTGLHRVTEHGFAHWLESHGHAEYAKSLKPQGDDVYEPVGTMPVVGDTIVNTRIGSYSPALTQLAQKVGNTALVTMIDGCLVWVGSENFSERCLQGRDSGLNLYRILKRAPKPAAGRCWKSEWDKAVRATVRDQDFVFGVSKKWMRAIMPNVEAVATPRYGYVELHGPERDAILEECKKAIKL